MHSSSAVLASPFNPSPSPQRNVCQKWHLRLTHQPILGECSLMIARSIARILQLTVLSGCWGLTGPQWLLRTSFT